MVYVIGAGGTSGMPLTSSGIAASGKGCTVNTMSRGPLGAEYVFAQANAAIATYSACHVDTTGKARLIDSSNAYLPGQFAVAIVSCSTGDYAWFQTRGNTRVVCAAATNKNVRLFTSATAGTLDDATSSTQAELLGLRLLASNGASASDAACFLGNVVIAAPVPS